MKKILLIRHGDIGATSPKRYIGQTNLPLTNLGREQIQKLTTELVTHSSPRIDAIYCSPLLRCTESASIISSPLGIQPVEVTDFQEINLGSWDGLKVSEVQKHFPKEYEKRGQKITTYRTPQGESFLDLQQRAWKAFSTVANDPDNSFPVIVTHAGVIRTILCKILDIKLQDMFRFSLSYGSFVLIRYTKHNFSFVEYT